mmetsp:Transcript_15690/g.28360  ORF Transcript_15690/g.28360 Transcript_15690/m.28360 type:complete len:192 (-) Transcript_15690:1786-2361(-)
MIHAACPTGRLTQSSNHNMQKKKSATTMKTSSRSISVIGRVDQESESPSNHAKLNSTQYRLFLINHAANCTAKDGECKHIYCLQMKDLLKHMASCRRRSCNVTHCRSSRVMMNHFNRCRDEECEVCAPVHEALMDEYWNGTKRKLNFTNENERPPVHEASMDEYWKGTKRKLNFTKENKNCCSTVTRKLTF